MKLHNRSCKNPLPAVIKKNYRYNHIKYLMFPKKYSILPTKFSQYVSIICVMCRPLPT